MKKQYSKPLTEVNAVATAYLMEDDNTGTIAVSGGTSPWESQGKASTDDNGDDDQTNIWGASSSLWD